MAHSTFVFGRIAPTHQDSKLALAARFGYAAKGLVYVTAGVLIAMAVFGFAKGEVTGTRGAIETLHQSGWGSLLMALTAAGLYGFALWRGVQAIRDPEDKGSDAMGLARRGGLLISGAIYASLAVYATRLLLDMNASGASADQRANEVMAQDGGALAIGLLGVGIIGVGLYQVYRAVTDHFKKNWKTGQMSEKEERIATWVSRTGIGARGVAFALIGTFLVWGAWTGQPDKAQGMAGMLNDVAQHPMGQTLVGIAGVGLLCYGLYCFCNALFREIEVE